MRLCPDEAMVAVGFDLSDEQARDRLELMQWDLAQELLDWARTWSSRTDSGAGPSET